MVKWSTFFQFLLHFFPLFYLQIQYNVEYVFSIFSFNLKLHTFIISHVKFSLTAKFKMAHLKGQACTAKKWRHHPSSARIQCLLFLWSGPRTSTLEITLTSNQVPPTLMRFLLKTETFPCVFAFRPRCRIRHENGSVDANWSMRFQCYENGHLKRY